MKVLSSIVLATLATAGANTAFSSAKDTAAVAVPESIPEGAKKLGMNVTGAQHLTSDQIAKLENTVRTIKSKGVPKATAVKSHSNEHTKKLDFQKLKQGVHLDNKFVSLSQHLKNIHSKERPAIVEASIEQHKDANRNLATAIRDNYVILSEYDYYYGWSKDGYSYGGDYCYGDPIRRTGYLVNYCYEFKEFGTSILIKANLNENALIQLEYDNTYCGGTPHRAYDIFSRATFSFNECNYGIQFDWVNSFPSDEALSNGVGIAYTELKCNLDNIFAFNWRQYSTCFTNPYGGSYVYFDWSNWTCENENYIEVYYFSDDYCESWYGWDWIPNSYCNSLYSNIDGVTDDFTGLESIYYSSLKCFNGTTPMSSETL